MSKGIKILIASVVLLIIIFTVVFLNIKNNLSLNFKNLVVDNPHFVNGVSALDFEVELEVSNNTWFTYNVQDIVAVIYNNVDNKIIGQTSVVQTFDVKKGINLLVLNINNVKILENLQTLQSGKSEFRFEVFLNILGITKKVVQVVEI